MFQDFSQNSRIYSTQLQFVNVFFGHPLTINTTKCENRESPDLFIFIHFRGDGKYFNKKGIGEIKTGEGKYIVIY